MLNIWWLIYAMSYINVFSGRKRGRSPRENPPKGDFVGLRMATIRLARKRYDKQ